MLPSATDFPPSLRGGRRPLKITCGAHALHDVLCTGVFRNIPSEESRIFCVFLKLHTSRSHRDVLCTWRIGVVMTTHAQDDRCIPVRRDVGTPAEARRKRP